MREILFRGRTNFEGRDCEWIYGSLLAESKNTFPIIARSYDNDEDWISIDEWATVDPETVGQYTGMTDKNGNKIFEGDIINIEYDETIVENAVVEYIGTSFYGSTDYDDWELDGYYQLEVIGNIHDNSELLNN